MPNQNRLKTQQKKIALRVTIFRKTKRKSNCPKCWKNGGVLTHLNVYNENHIASRDEKKNFLIYPIISVFDLLPRNWITLDALFQLYLLIKHVFMQLLHSIKTLLHWSRRRCNIH